MLDYQHISRYINTSTLLHTQGCDQELSTTKMLKYYTDK